MYQYKDFLQLHTNTAILFRYFDTADADSISKMFPASNLLQVPDIWYEKNNIDRSCHIAAIDS